MTRMVTHEQLAQWGACAEQREVVERLYPDGVPVTLEAAVALRTAGVDVLWGAVRLLSKALRRAFIRFTLDQRQEPVAVLFERAGLAPHATAIRALTPRTALSAVKGVYDAAAWAAAARAAEGAAEGAAAAWAAAVAAARAAAAWAAAGAAAAGAAAGDAAWAVAGAAAGGVAAGDAAWAAAVDAQLAWIASALATGEGAA